MSTRLYQTDGGIADISPANGKHFTLDELQEYVGGYIEFVKLPTKDIMLVNEEGLIHNLPLNPAASAMAGYDIVGNVVVCQKGQLR